MKRLIIPMLLLTLLVGCSDDSDNPAGPGTPNKLIPLTIGTTLKWQHYSLNLFTGVFSLRDTVSASVKKDSVIGNETWTYISGSTMRGLYANRSTGFWGYDDTYGGQLFFKYPAQVNDTYMIFSNDSGSQDTLIMKVLSTNQSVTVLAGTFSCITYEGTLKSQGLTATYHVAPGIGYVQVNVDAWSSKLGTMIPLDRLNLISYTVK